VTMTAAGWLFAAVAWTAIISLTAWCMVRLLRQPLDRPPGE
jgi:hypothetical protein